MPRFNRNRPSVVGEQVSALGACVGSALGSAVGLSVGSPVGSGDGKGAGTVVGKSVGYGLVGSMDASETDAEHPQDV